MTTYLDWNATSPRHPDVTLAMQRAEEDGWANPSSVHDAGRRARRFIEDTREQLGALLRRSPRDVVFTGSGTEANHLAVSGAKWVITTKTEHPSLTRQAEVLAERGARVVHVEVAPSGQIEIDALEAALDRCLVDAPRAHEDRDAGGLNNANTPLVAVSAVNHETGVVQPLEAIAASVRKRGARLHIDAVQLIGRGDLAPLEHADSIAIAGHKFRGPKGIGALVFDCGWTPLPLGRGGAQERGLRPGTLDAGAIAGLGAALGRLGDSLAGYRSAALLGARLVSELEQRGRGITFHGGSAQRLGHVVNLRAEGWKGDELVAALDLAGICVSSGSACSAGTAEPSPVIEAMLGREAARGAVRISFGEQSTEGDLLHLLTSLEKLGVLNPARGAGGRAKP